LVKSEYVTLVSPGTNVPKAPSNPTLPAPGVRDREAFTLDKAEALAEEKEDTSYTNPTPITIPIRVTIIIVDLRLRLF